MASGWNLLVWLECIGVVSGCCCKEVYRFPHNNYFLSLLHLYSLFLAAASHARSRSEIPQWHHYIHGYGQLHRGSEYTLTSQDLS